MVEGICYSKFGPQRLGCCSWIDSNIGGALSVLASAFDRVSNLSHLVPEIAGRPSSTAPVKLRLLVSRLALMGRNVSTR
jgi:hypothetical protein